MIIGSDGAPNDWAAEYHCMARDPVTGCPCMMPAAHIRSRYYSQHCTMGGVFWSDAAVAAPPSPPPSLDPPAPEEPARVERCAFCPAPAEFSVTSTIHTCSRHSREGWRLRGRLELGGLSDTEYARQEVLRHVAARDAFLREEQREMAGARTGRDYDLTRGPRGHLEPHPSLTEQKPPPEEIPLVGTTPHYEWP